MNWVAYEEGRISPRERFALFKRRSIEGKFIYGRCGLRTESRWARQRQRRVEQFYLLKERESWSCQLVPGEESGNDLMSQAPEAPAGERPTEVRI